MICSLVLFKTSAAFILLVLPHLVSNAVVCPYGYIFRKFACLRAIYHGRQLQGQISGLLGAPIMQTTRKLYTLPPVTTTKPTSLESESSSSSEEDGKKHVHAKNPKTIIQSPSKNFNPWYF